MDKYTRTYVKPKCANVICWGILATKSLEGTKVCLNTKHHTRYVPGHILFNPCHYVWSPCNTLNCTSDFPTWDGNAYSLPVTMWLLPRVVSMALLWVFVQGKHLSNSVIAFCLTIKSLWGEGWRLTIIGQEFCTPWYQALPSNTRWQIPVETSGMPRNSSLGAQVVHARKNQYHGCFRHRERCMGCMFLFQKLWLARLPLCQPIFSPGALHPVGAALGHGKASWDAAQPGWVFLIYTAENLACCSDAVPAHSPW